MMGVKRRQGWSQLSHFRQELERLRRLPVRVCPPLVAARAVDRLRRLLWSLNPVQLAATDSVTVTMTAIVTVTVTYIGRGRHEPSF